MKKSLYIIAAVMILFIVFVAWKITKIDTFAEIPRQAVDDQENVETNFNLSSCFKKTNNADVPYEFISACYLNATDIKNIKAIRGHLLSMDSITHDESFNRRTLSTVLTKDVAERMAKKWAVYAPDSLLVLLQWAEQFKYYAAIYNNDDIFYRSLYSYWLNFIADKLSAYSYKKPSLKYDFKFKYLLTRIKEQNFTTCIKVTSWEKFIDNIIYSNWGHLFNATWNQSDWVLKVGIVLFLLIFVYGIIMLFKDFLNLIKKNKK